ncbi:MAG: iron-sulfur cluster-binding domain-containing protein [Bacilli bacterium]|nr:iron-sulfur cluster-binding domain-containing protein [Bacilli bacterium]
MKKFGFFQGISGLLKLLKLRKNKIKNADSTIKEDHVGEETKKLHRGPVPATLLSRIEIGPGAFLLRFGVEEPPLFQAGQFVSLRFRIGNSLLTRPYSIVSSPGEAYRDKAFEIVVADNPQGFAAPYLCHELSIGSSIEADIGHGRLTFNPVRDGNNVVVIAGGSGITPWISFAKWIHENPDLPYRLTILHGSVDPNNAIGDKTIETLNDERIRLIPVISGPYEFKGEKGLITKEVIRRYAKEDECPTYFICGSTAMDEFIRGELKKLGVNQRHIRSEAFTDLDPKDPDFPKDLIGKAFRMHVLQGNKETVVECSAEESIASSLERAGLYVRTCCRTGNCGGCKARLLKGEILVRSKPDNRRQADIEAGYFLTCVTYPKSDLTIRLPIPPRGY